MGRLVQRGVANRWRAAAIASSKRPSLLSASASRSSATQRSRERFPALRAASRRTRRCRAARTGEQLVAVRATAPLSASMPAVGSAATALNSARSKNASSRFRVTVRRWLDQPLIAGARAESSASASTPSASAPGRRRATTGSPHRARVLWPFTARNASARSPCACRRRSAERRPRSAVPPQCDAQRLHRRQHATKAQRLDGAGSRVTFPRSKWMDRPRSSRGSAVRARRNGFGTEHE